MGAVECETSCLAFTTRTNGYDDRSPSMSCYP